MLQVNGKITYNGETFDKFVPQRTASYVDQVPPSSPPPLFPLPVSNLMKLYVSSALMWPAYCLLCSADVMYKPSLGRSYLHDPHLKVESRC